MRQLEAAHNTLLALRGKCSLRPNGNASQHGDLNRIPHMRYGFKLVIVICGILVSMSGCANKPGKDVIPLTEHTGNYRTVAEINYKELKAVAEISQDTPSSCSVVFESPPSLKDMAFIFRKDSVDLNYRGLSFRFEPDSLPASAAAKLAVSAINRAMKDDGLTVELKGSSLEVTGSMESGEFKLLLDKETGNIMKLSVPAEELEIEFNNFNFLD